MIESMQTIIIAYFILLFIEIPFKVALDISLKENRDYIIDILNINLNIKKINNKKCFKIEVVESRKIKSNFMINIQDFIKNIKSFYDVFIFSLYKINIQDSSKDLNVDKVSLSVELLTKKGKILPNKECIKINNSFKKCKIYYNNLNMHEIIEIIYNYIYEPDSKVLCLNKHKNILLIKYTFYYPTQYFILTINLPKFIKINDNNINLELEKYNMKKINKLISIKKYNSKNNTIIIHIHPSNIAKRFFINDTIYIRIPVEVQK